MRLPAFVKRRVTVTRSPSLTPRLAFATVLPARAAVTASDPLTGTLTRTRRPRDSARPSFAFSARAVMAGGAVAAAGDTDGAAAGAAAAAAEAAAGAAAAGAGTGAGDQSGCVASAISVRPPAD